MKIRLKYYKKINFKWKNLSKIIKELNFDQNIFFLDISISKFLYIYFNTVNIYFIKRNNKKNN